MRFSSGITMVGALAGGFIACTFATLFFGLMFVPLKGHDCGDGFFVQWVMCVAIFMVGICVNAIQQFPKFYPLAMLGGALWATGNVTSMPIIQTIGMGLGILLWSSTNLLAGWASGRFGWFGLKEQIPNNPALNYVAVVLAMISTVMFAFVKNHDPSAPVDSDRDHGAISDDTEPILTVNANQNSSEDDDIIRPPEVGPVSPPPVRRRFFHMGNNKRLIMVVVALVAGIFYGLCFAPVIWVQDNVQGAPKEGLDYVFAFFCGILAASSVYFVVYCGVKRGRPFINPRTVLPSFIAGLSWGIAQSAFFIANETLMEAVSFPIITRFPGLISALLGVVVYKEVRGKKNLQILVAAILVTIAGGILSGLSLVKW